MFISFRQSGPKQTPQARDNPTGAAEDETTNKHVSIRQKHVFFVFFF